MNREADLSAIRSDFRRPGVYYQTLARPRREEQQFHTGIPVFIGFAEKKKQGRQPTQAQIGPEMYQVDRWEQFEQLHQPLPFSESYLVYAIRGFFENGGRRCVVLPVQYERNSPSEELADVMAEALTKPFIPGGVLEDFDEIDLICVPDAMVSVIRTHREKVIEIQSAVVDHTRRMGDRFAILDGLSSDNDSKGRSLEQDHVAPAILHWQSLPPEYGALYYPWVWVKKVSLESDAEVWPPVGVAGDRQAMQRANPVVKSLNSQTAKLVPACGHIAGIYSRTDSRTGTHKAPANELLEDVHRAEIDFTNDELATLNEAGINCLSGFAGHGIRVWGARTLSGQPSWLYVNVLRLFLTLTRWARLNMNDLVFETNDGILWERVRQRLNAYCRDLFDRGALMGTSPTEAFFVKCDSETNTRETREAGLVVADVGLAPAVPAEFIIVRITQSASATVATEYSAL
ncbi:phage tail sheath family protein [Nitrosospira sp. Is2]|uniref:phage tail sheath family protein n=1 Tax=Nitrosospira sp. Is2 TaxID=3080532 RepID=UPI0029548FF9|nr:phage tail sheath subtilisin-like domain-containing protein [Nitrosospira sp. Is2]WON73509.1 phage tail sheath subtilisin-like domain-containing protein [Nitrosospira sp. Is2]